LGHDHNRLELVRLAPAAADTRRHLEVLGRLNSIAALGVPEGTDLAGLMKPLEPRLRPCDFEGSPAPEVSPCCQRCAYLLRTLSPQKDLNDVFERTRRALQIKLASLAQSAIARLIHQHDSSRRLEGFLKIVQAAQTDSLIRVLDDDLAGYLTRLLDESLPLADGDAVVSNVIIVPAAIVAHGESLDHKGRQALRELRAPGKTLGSLHRPGRVAKVPPDSIR